MKEVLRKAKNYEAKLSTLDVSLNLGHTFLYRENGELRISTQVVAGADKKPLVKQPVNMIENTYPLTGMYEKTLFARTGEPQKVIQFMPEVEKLEVLNKAMKFSAPANKRKYAKVVVYEEEARAIPSDTFLPLSITELLDRLKRRMDLAFPDKYTVLHEEFSPEYSVVRLAINDEKLNETYSKALGVRFGGSRARVMLQFQTSDTGLSCATLIPQIEIEGRRLYSGEPMSVPHVNCKDDHPLCLWDALCEGIYPLLKDSCDDLSQMAQIDISNPVAAFLNMCKKWHIGESIVNDSPAAPVLRNWQASGATKKATDLYLLLTKVTANMTKKNFTSAVGETLIAEKLRKIIFMDAKEWKKLDKPTSTYKLEGIV